jgi:hypothetical protein
LEEKIMPPIMKKLLRNRFFLKTGKNVLVYTLFFFAAVWLTSLVYGSNLPDDLAFVFSYVLENMPVITLLTVLVASILFGILVLSVSVLAVGKEARIFSTSWPVRFSVFFLNIIPVVIFHDDLSQIFGFGMIFFFPIYFILQYILENIQNKSSYALKNNKLFFFVFKYLTEIALFVFALFLTRIIVPKQYFHIEWRELDLDVTYESFHYITYLFYILLYNCITFFTIEYGISCVKEEYKKNYVKYHFRYTSNPFKKFLHLLRSSSVQILIKVKKNLSWLIFFTLTVETIFEPSSTIGFSLIRNYRDQPVAVIHGILYIIFMMFAVNTFIDYVVLLLQRQEDKPAIQWEYTKEIVTRKKNLWQKNAFIAAALILYAALIVFCQREYPIAAYYDFEINREKSVKNVIDQWGIVYDSGDLKALETPLCKNLENGPGYTITILEISGSENTKRTIIPIFEKTKSPGTFYFIEGQANRQGKDVLSPAHDRLTGIKTITKYNSVLFQIFYSLPKIGKAETGFRLPADLSKSTFTMKPLYLIAPYYLVYIATLIMIVYFISLIAYHFSVKQCIGMDYKYEKGQEKNKMLKNLIYGFGKYGLLFLNSITSLLIFLLANRFIERMVVDKWFWINNSFLINIASYTVIQIVFVVMFSDSYNLEINLHAKKILTSQEFQYLRLTGVGPKGLYQNYHTKYGKGFFHKLFIQNVFFVININFFISYAFNVWAAVNDHIGITYAISFENIITKIVHEKPDGAELYNYIILGVFYFVLFFLYYISQKKLEENQ